MASRTFDAALNEPDIGASHLLLYQLIAANDFDSLTSVTAERYLNAFCNTNSSYTQRRWIGLAFAGMVGASASVVNHLRQMPHGLQKLGAIVLSGTELEETRIIAGLAMRQALVHDIEYSNFWASDKVRNSAPNFPKDLDARWMARFQDFLDALHSLALTTSNNDASIMYPVSLVGLDGFQWSTSNEGLPVAIIQAGSLTMILPDRNLRNIHFLDVPINHIRSARSQQSTLHDSQERTSEHEPWELVLTLQVKPWSYRFNTSACQGTELTFIFEHCADAKEWESCINEHQHSTARSMGLPPLRIHPQMSSSSPIKCGSIQSANKNTKDHTTKHNFPPSQEETKSCSPGNPPEPPVDPQNIKQDNTVNSRSKVPGLAQVKGEMGRIEANGNAAVTDGRTKEVSSRSQPPKTSMEAENSANYTQMQDLPSSHEQPNEYSPAFQTATTGSISKPATSSKGKLPRVSQSAKNRAFRRHPEPADDMDIPTHETPETDIGHNKEASTGKRGNVKPRQQPKPPKSIGAGQKRSTRDTRSRGKRKADDHDEFVPDEGLSKSTIDTSRTSRATAATGTNKRRKRIHKESSEDVMATSDEAQVTRKDKKIDTIVQRPTKLASKARQPVQAQLGADEGLASSVKSSKASLIKGLVDSQKPKKPSIATFKKPLRPVQSVQQPSTPIKARKEPTESSKRARTPVNVRTHSIDRSLSVFRSSPPLQHTADESNVWTPHIAAHTEILSSNSKPVPASPNAESTAISGHADREDVDVELKMADVQTAKNDPFRHRRVNQKVTSFTRRLTGGNVGGSPTKSIEATGSGSPELERTDVRALNLLLPETMPWVRKDQQQVLHRKPNLTSVDRTGTPQKHRSQQSARRNQTPKQPTHARSSPSKALGAFGQSAAHTVKEINGRPAEIVLRNTDRTSTSGTVPYQSRSRTADAIAKHHEQIVPITTTNDAVAVASRQLAGDMQVTKPTSFEQDTDLDMDGDETLIENDGYGENTAGLIASSVHFPSSPPIGGSPSSHSSTSADSGLPPTDPPLPNSEAEELEWEASLNPHQRALHDLLIRTSKRVLRHVVDNETAVTDIAEIFERDGEHVLRSLLQRHDGDYEHVFHEMNIEGKNLQHELQDVSKHLADQRKRIRAMV
ncbi:hypothetical protein J1614_012011 [Plenodomus biglobosus]|nr:hypothetical protein J1614_012011 [Plenodomus biglobosus]